MKILRSGLFSLLYVAATCLTAWAQTATIQGQVTDAGTGDPLPGANVLVVSPGATTSTVGAATDFDGNFTISNVAAGSYELLVRFVGFQDTRIPITLNAGQTLVQDIAVEEEGFDLNTVVVTASRQAEKVLDAPASISVLDAREIEQTGGAPPVTALRNTTGVDMSQTGADRYEVVLRGFNNAFSGATYTLVDYRQSSIPSLAVNAYTIMPISNIDIERAEVVRGPGSALYGAGVDAGVIHFVTKNPFNHPGTTVSVYGGERSLAGVDFRHAAVVNDKFGYKISGTYAQVNDWQLDPEDPLDAIQLSGDAVPRSYDTRKLNLNGMVEYKFNPRTSLIVNGGRGTADNIFLTGVGTAQSDGFSYTYGQVRLQAGAFFAQAYLNRNDSGNSTILGTGADLVENSKLMNAQAQYDLLLAGGKERLIIGADFERVIPNTGGTIYGRNEDNDNITEFGAYAQSTTQISPKLDLTVAGRIDYNDVVEKVQVSPRVAVVFKPDPANSVRATYNRAFSSPGNNSLFLDIVAGENVVVPDVYKILVRGRGAVQGFTYRRNPDFENLVGTDLVATYNVPVPGVWNTDGPVGLDLGFVYNLVFGALSQLPLETINAALGVTLNQALFDLLVNQLDPENTVVEGWTSGTLGRLNLSSGGVDFINDVIDIPPLEQTSTHTFELGYKGIINNNFLLAVDTYYTRKKNFVGPLLVETPFVFVPTLLDDFSAALEAGIVNNVQFAGLLTVLQSQFPDLDFSPAGVANAISTLAAGELPTPSDPIAIVQPEQNLDGPEGPELMLSYRNFGNVKFWGVDVTTQYIVNDRLDLFGSFSYVSDDFFDDEEIEEEGTGKFVALNATKLKFKAGLTYSLPASFNVKVSGRYIDGFPIRSGPYVGEIDSYFLLDLGFGYDLTNVAPGLRFDVQAQNILNNEHREFIGAPEIGRFTSARLTYSF